MNCKQSKRLIHEYIDGELESGRTLSLEQHLNECLPCRRYQGRMRETAERLRGAPGLAAPAGLDYLVNSRLGLAMPHADGGWFATLQFRMLEFPFGETLRSTVLATPITVMIFTLISLLVYSPSGMENLRSLLRHNGGSAMRANLVERQYLQNLYDFSPELLSGDDIYQPRISTASMKVFIENDFQRLETNHLGVVASVDTTGRAEVESVSTGGRRTALLVQNMLESSIVFPAIAKGKTINTKMLLTFEKVEVKG